MTTRHSLPLTEPSQPSQPSLLGPRNTRATWLAIIRLFKPLCIDDVDPAATHSDSIRAFDLLFINLPGRPTQPDDDATDSKNIL